MSTAEMNALKDAIVNELRGTQTTTTAKSNGKASKPVAFKTPQEEIAYLRAKLAEQKKPATMSLKVSDKGAISVYGLMRFPVTLYAEQWERLFSLDAAIRQFIADNKSRLTFKNTQ